MAETVTVDIDANLDPFRDALKDLTKLSDSFGAQLTSALKSAVLGGQELDDILRRIGLNLAGMALNQGLKPLQSLISGLIGGLLPGGGASVTAFAKGGVISSPSYFPTGGGLGLAGEAGPEAVLPLARGADGRLGVASASGGGGLSVVFNVTATDAASFRKSEAQITGMLARAVSRGGATF